MALWWAPLPHLVVVSGPWPPLVVECLLIRSGRGGEMWDVVVVLLRMLCVVVRDMCWRRVWCREYAGRRPTPVGTPLEIECAYVRSYPFMLRSSNSLLRRGAFFNEMRCW